MGVPTGYRLEYVDSLYCGKEDNEDGQRDFQHSVAVPLDEKTPDFMEHSTWGNYYDLWANSYPNCLVLDDNGKWVPAKKWAMEYL